MASNADSCVRHLANFSSAAGHTELTQCSQSALHLGLAEYTLGNASLGVAYVDHLLASVSSAAQRGTAKGNMEAAKDVEEEAAEWLQRFVRATLPTPPEHGLTGRRWNIVERHRCFAMHLLSRALPLLLRSAAAGAAVRKEPRLARLVVELQQLMQLSLGVCPAALDEVRLRLEAIDDAVDRDFGWPHVEVLALRRLVSSVHWQRGDVTRGIEVLERGLQSQLDNSVETVAAYADLAAMQLQDAGQSASRWREAVNTFRQARELAEGIDAAFAHHLSSSYRHASRLAHRRGVYDTCPGPLDAFLYGEACRD